MVFSILPRQSDCASIDIRLVYVLLTGIARSSTECLGIHLGNSQTANLGDGNGNVAQTMELRENLEVGGTCAESLIGGNHLRMFRQNGTNHYTGALFLACVAHCIFFSLLCRISYRISRSVSEEEVAQLSLGRTPITYFHFSRMLSRVTQSLLMAMMLAGE